MWKMNFLQYIIQYKQKELVFPLGEQMSNNLNKLLINFE